MKVVRSATIELMKLKRRRLLFLAVGAILFSIVTAYLPSISTGRFDWQELLSSSLFISAEVLFLVFSYVTGVVFATEYEYNTIEAVLCTSVTVSEIVVGKVVAVLTFAFLLMLGAIACTLTTGFAFRFGTIPVELFLRYCRAYAIIVLLQLCYVPFYMLVSVSTKKVIYPSVIGISMVIIMMVFAVASYAKYIPPCFPVLIQAEILGQNAYTGEFLRTQQLSVVEPTTVVLFQIAIALIPIPFCSRYLHSRVR